MKRKSMAITTLVILLTAFQFMGCAGDVEKETEEISKQDAVEMEVSESIEEENTSSEENIHDAEYFNGSDSVEEEVSELPYEQKEEEQAEKTEGANNSIPKEDYAYYCKYYGVTEEQLKSMTDAEIEQMIIDRMENRHSSSSSSSSSSSNSSNSSSEGYTSIDDIPNELPAPEWNLDDVPAGRME